jgi:hypothetical protein
VSRIPIDFNGRIGPHRETAEQLAVDPFDRYNIESASVEEQASLAAQPPIATIGECVSAANTSLFGPKPAGEGRTEP